MSTTTRPRVPTMRAVDHVAFTVPNLDEAVRFFVDHFGAELVFTDGPFVDDESTACVGASTSTHGHAARSP